MMVGVECVLGRMIMRVNVRWAKSPTETRFRVRDGDEWSGVCDRLGKNEFYREGGKRRAVGWMKQFREVFLRQVAVEWRADFWTGGVCRSTMMCSGKILEMQWEGNVVQCNSYSRGRGRKGIGGEAPGIVGWTACALRENEMDLLRLGRGAGILGMRRKQVVTKSCAWIETDVDKTGRYWAVVIGKNVIFRAEQCTHSEIRTVISCWKTATNDASEADITNKMVYEIKIWGGKHRMTRVTAGRATEISVVLRNNEHCLAQLSFRNGRDLSPTLKQWATRQVLLL